MSGALVLLPFSFNLSSALVNGMFLVLEMFLVYLCTALHTIRKAVGFILNAMFCCHYGGGSLFYCPSDYLCGEVANVDFAFWFSTLSLGGC